MTTTFNDTYEIRSVIGRGGMSTVYLAEHKRLHTRWAVKQVRKEQGTKFDFLAESNILKKLQHPMLPRIVDIFEDAESIYIVEDFVEGITLEKLLEEQGRVDEARGLGWFKDLCSVLGYLHRQKPHPIIYRDLKPSNIMLQPDGTLKLIDFGIAREYKQESSADTTYIGTKGYAAPEQFGTAQTDERTDIYSLGVTMYHLLTGKSPYQPPYQFVPARQLVPGLSAGTEYILGKCVQPEPADRYQHVPELLDDLEHIYRFDQAWQKYVRARRGRRVLLGVMLAASVALMAGGLLLHRQETIAAEAAIDRQYEQLLSSLDPYYQQGDTQGALAVIQQARELRPERAESYRQEAYALYLGGQYQDCVDYAQELLSGSLAGDSDLMLIQASACFELADYEQAAQLFQQGAQGSELSVDHLRDYAVCLGRLGELDQAQAVLDQLAGRGGTPEATQYVSGELAYARQDYAAAETEFLQVLDQTDDSALIRRCYLSLAETYRDSAQYDKSIQLIQQALSRTDLGQGTLQNSVFYEMLGAAYYSRGTLAGGGAEDLRKAAESFEQVIGMGVQKEYLYINAFTAWQSLGEYDQAAAVLDRMEQAYPQLYTPHALRATLYIMEENQKDQTSRSYAAAYAEYEKALELVTSQDETSYLQQLEGLIQQLRAGGWL